MTTEPKLNKSTGRLAVAEAHALACWNVLVKHCEAGRCNCHLGIGGSVHILNGCAVGRMLNEEYEIASHRVRNFFGNQPELPLEAGDMGSTLEPQREGAPHTTPIVPWGPEYS